MKPSTARRLSVLALLGPLAAAQQPIGRTTAQEVKVSGAVDVHGGEMLLGNGSTIAAGDKTVAVALTRGGELRLCSTTSVHLSRDRSIESADGTGLQIALDRGALEASYTAGKYSDVLLTPDFRILISGPGRVDLRVRVSSKGDTCVENHGAGAPYVTVSSQFDGGAYRVQPDQRVLFERGSLRDVVDNEKEPCGCPPAAAVPLNTAAAGPSSTAADTAFPIAVSEGLAAPAAPPSTPVSKPGEVHAQVTVPLTYDGATGKTGAPAEPAAPPAASAAKQPSGGVFHRIGRFFSRIFGG